MISIDRIKINDRIRFDNPICNGYGALGTIKRIEYTTPPIVWIRWDCHGKEVGQICHDNKLQEWIQADNTGLKNWMEEK